jgi:hypothetical protein
MRTEKGETPIKRSLISLNKIKIPLLLKHSNVCGISPIQMVPKLQLSSYRPSPSMEKIKPYFFLGHSQCLNEGKKKSANFSALVGAEKLALSLFFYSGGGDRTPDLTGMNRTL